MEVDRDVCFRDVGLDFRLFDSSPSNLISTVFTLEYFAALESADFGQPKSLLVFACRRDDGLSGIDDTLESFVGFCVREGVITEVG